MALQLPILSIARDRAAYLSDPHGRTTTYPATNAANEEYGQAALVLSKRPANPEETPPVKNFLKAHGNDRMDIKESAKQTVRAVEAKKQKIGPGLDRGGCTLVNEARRATFVQNEGLAREVDYDY